MILPSATFASHIQLEPCIKKSHCVIEEWDTENIERPISKVRLILEDTPRTKIVELNGDYIHAEVTSRIMKYIDDLEISFLPEKNHLIVRSESRVGDGDFGVNQKRVNLLKSELIG